MRRIKKDVQEKTVVSSFNTEASDASASECSWEEKQLSLSFQCSGSHYSDLLVLTLVCLGSDLAQGMIWVKQT